MKVSVDQLAQRLAAELGPAAVNGEPADLASHAVDGKRPALICTPETAEQVGAVLCICSDAEAAVTPWGGGTAMAIGNPPRQVDLVVTTRRLNRVIEHDHANLTATLQSGIALSVVQEILARQKQFLPLDPPQPSQSTIGGIVAANLNGLRRAHYGSSRDLVIGMKVALASGELIKAGGKVVKNVAGYDMCKLFVGSLGTLGIITEATLRMTPIPETAATVIGSGTLAQALQLADDTARSPLFPAAIVLSNPVGIDATGNMWKIAVWSEGFEETVARHVHDVESMARRIGLGVETIREKRQREWWDAIREFPLQDDRVVYRVTVPRASVAACVRAMQDWGASRPAIVIDAAAGTLWVAADVDESAALEFSKLIALAAEQRGHATLFSAPGDLKERRDVWGPAPATLALMRGIKHQFDPKGLLNPGRFVAGL